MCQVRMVARVCSVIGKVGEVGCISGDALMEALIDCGFLDTVWESYQIWELRMAWLGEITELLMSVWSAKLTKQLRDKLMLSYDALDELRFSLSQ